jgi:hypothetical protein
MGQAARLHRLFQCVHGIEAADIPFSDRNDFAADAVRATRDSLPRISVGTHVGLS